MHIHKSGRFAVAILQSFCIIFFFFDSTKMKCFVAFLSFFLILVSFDHCIFLKFYLRMKNNFFLFCAFNYFKNAVRGMLFMEDMIKCASELGMSEGNWIVLANELLFNIYSWKISWMSNFRVQTKWKKR